jgi:ABC-type branched-subunit amino acid transport system ATPase component
MPKTACDQGWRLAPLTEEHLIKTIRKVAQTLVVRGLLIEHNAMLALEFSDTAYVIEL